MAKMQAFKCPCCGGSREFDSSVQKMKCPFCDTEFDVGTLSEYAQTVEEEQPELNIVKEYMKDGMYGGVIHCFSYSKEIAREYLNMGLYLGIGGVVTFKNSRKLKEVAEYAPLNQILLETDCPYMAPVPNRGKRNSSLYLPEVVKTIAEIKGISCEEVVAVTESNALKVFGVI